MAIEFRVKRNSFSKEQEFIEKISKLLSAISVESPSVSREEQKPAIPIQKRKIEVRTQSMCPTFKVFQYDLPEIKKKPTISVTFIEKDSRNPPVSQVKSRKVYKPRVRNVFIKSSFRRRSVQTDVQDLDKYQKILNLTQTLIDKDNLKGWN